MVSKIISGKSIIGALKYNENKVAKGKAELIWENGFQKDIPFLSFSDKLSRLEDLAAKNRITKTNTVHISLNFAVGEHLERDKMNQIAFDYMERIGFGNQPYLVYRHDDAGHSHIHIVSTNIKTTGERIPLHNLGKTKSEVARKHIEREYGLIQASSRAQIHSLNGKLEKVEYGKIDTKRALTNVVSGVIKNYRFTSLPEFNAVLSHFNVIADRGAKDSRMYSKNGLVYWVTNGNGTKVGVPIKASSIYGRPTLKNIEKRYELNDSLRKPHKQHLQNTIERVANTKMSQAGFILALAAKEIQVIFRKNEEGRIFGVTFVDHQHQVVFNGSDLGKSYSAPALLAKFDQPQAYKLNQPPAGLPCASDNNTTSREIKHFSSEKSLVSSLLQVDYQDQTSPELLKNGRKKKRKRLTS
ncbi:MAG TPA: relaxase/mobilization nuclease domain-containing protein [Sphingobacteriaceae bacterium]|nr:relaxase/mobilization nuclease domain-containing protein [Sphingobacteriaceae bacterium]